MPLTGTGHSQSVYDESQYFTSLSQLDDWAVKPAGKLYGVLPYVPRSRLATDSTSSSRGNLLVCHDYKGGYTEIPSSLCYTFNFWSYCESFIYFSHHRVTVPPSGWITAAHRQGVKMLGTLIFEGSDELDCLRLLFGRLPTSSTGPALPSSSVNSFPVSPYYARILAQLARQRGFDGYLLNFECLVRGGPDQTRALSSWISLLQVQLHAEVGPHSQVVWYDSVVYTGQLRWQDRLNNFNLPFFLASSTFFSNYTWPPYYPKVTAQYFKSLQMPNKSLKDIYMGVDVWGRGSYGDGGFGSYKAIEQIDPKLLGLSVALFGPAWTWESEQDKPGWNWNEWWKYERKLWIGPENPDEVVPVPPLSDLSLKKRAIAPDTPLPGPFLPISSFFLNRPPPNPIDLPFCTCFSPGVGWRWFVRGKEVMKWEEGWSDIQKQSSLGDLVWPKPIVQWEDGGGQGELPNASSSLDMSNAWLGGNSLRLSLSFDGDEEAFFRCVWIPIQSIAITPLKSYDARLVYKVDSRIADFEVAVSVRSEFEFNISSMSSKELLNGWTELQIQFTLQQGPTSNIDDIVSSIGVIIGCAVEDPSMPCDVSILLGMITVSPNSSVGPGAFTHIPKILWADHTANVLTWEIAAIFDPLTPAALIPRTEDDPTLIWELAPASFFPKFLYFNVWVERTPLNGVCLPEKAEFVGTTGWDGRMNRFYVDRVMLPESLNEGNPVRFYIQGVTDRGDIPDWTQCVFVDAKIQS